MREALTNQWRRQAEEYRRRAVECQNKAAQTADEWAQRSFLDTSESWMRLALQAVRRIVYVERQPSAEDKDG